MYKSGIYAPALFVFMHWYAPALFVFMHWYVFGGSMHRDSFLGVYGNRMSLML